MRYTSTSALVFVAATVQFAAGCAGDSSGTDPGTLGGAAGTGVAETGGAVSTGAGGNGIGVGGNSSTGSGSQTGGASTSGGQSTGAQSTGGAATGGRSTGGAATGGAATGGAATGGRSAGGASTGGQSAGGQNSGGAATGGAATGGAATGGAATGGAATGGAATGGAATGGATSAQGGSACNVAPVNPNATREAKNLLCYLYDIYGTSVLSGQQETSWQNPASDISWYESNGMKPPAILGGDYLYPNGTTDRAIAYWKAGGITMIRYHMGAPPLQDSYDNSKGTANIANVLNESHSDNANFRSKLDYVAKELQKLQDANVPVLWAPFHETQPNGWFWWAKGTATQFIDLWKYMYNYLTTTKGLNNLVWLMPFSGTPSASWYPGKAYVDVGGPDTYATNQPFTAMFSSARSIFGTSMPIALHETGLIPTPSAMFPTAAPWVLFNIWAGYQKDGQHNTTNNIQSVYADSHVITRDEVPNLK